ncbi:MAG: TatD family hydrolase [Rhodobacteraceae bacterium]|nr:TatD family hydrolase [Paracoccaceae bacterium]
MQAIELVDSHCHLDFPDFADDLGGVISRAAAAGVKRVLTICTSLGQFDNVASIAEQYRGVYFAAGTHPHRAATDPMAEFDRLLELTAHPKMVAIGESGLDYHYTSDIAEAQKQSLSVHISAARESGLPLIIHSRDADRDMMEILQREQIENGPFNCVMHCFSSGPELAATALALGFYLSMSGIVTFRRSGELRQIFADAPVERILVETDAPYLAPVPHRGKRNEPGYVVHTAAHGAGLFGMEINEFAARTTENFDRLFTKAAEPPGN